MWMFYTLSLCFLALACQHALALTCGDNVNTKNQTTGFFSGPPEGYKAKQPCNLTISLPDGNLTINVKLSMVSMADNDSLLVYDGENALLANFTSKSDFDKVLIGFQEKLTFTFKPSGPKSRSSWSASFDTIDCQVNIQNNWIIKLDSPIYLKTTTSKDLECTYTLTNLLPADYIAAAAFTAFSFSGNSSLQIEGAQGNPKYTNSTARNDFFAAGSDPLLLKLKIADTSSVQTFSLIVEPVLKVCSGPVGVNGSKDVAGNFSPSDRHSVCRWLVSSEQRPLLHARVSSLRLPAGGGGDSLSFRSGGSSRTAPLDTLVNDVDDYLVVTSSSTMVVTLTMGVLQKQCELNITFMDAECGGSMSEHGFLTVTKDTKEDVYFSLVASPGQWIDVSSISNLTNSTSVNFYDGPQRSSPLLTIWTDGDQDLTPVTGHEQMLVVVSSLAAGEVFNASFSSVTAGCDTLTSAASGSRTFTASNQTCTWTVAPILSTGTVMIRLSSLNLRDQESLTVMSGVDSTGQVLAHFTGPHTLGGSPLPQVYIPATPGFMISYTSVASNSSLTGAVVQYSTLPQVCGGELSQPNGMIQTPNYPNEYPLNAQCDWTVKKSDEMTASPSSLLLLSFSSLSLAQDHSISVLRTQEKKSQLVAKYGGLNQSPSKLPNDLILPGAPDLTVAFSSQPGVTKPAPGSVNQVSGGASLNYWILECGGNLTTADGFFTSPGYPKPPTKSALCVWILNVADVKGPKNSTNILSFDVKAEGKDAKLIGQYLKIYDGPSMRSPYYPLSENATNLTRYDSIVVVFDFDAKSKPDIRLNFTYQTKICNSSELCANGICMHEDWKCNGNDDCGDNSDEHGCIVPPKPQSYSGWVKVGWVPGCLIIGLFLGAGLVFFGPIVVRKIRNRSASYNRMEEPEA